MLSKIIQVQSNSFLLKKQSLTNANIFRQKLNYKLSSVSCVEIVERCIAARDLSHMF